MTVKLELLGTVKLEPVAAMSEPMAVMLEPVAVMLEPVVARLEPVVAMLEPEAAMLELVVTGPPVDNLEPVESDVLALLVKQAVRYLVCAIEW